MKQCVDDNKCYSCIIPEEKYCGLIFISQDSDTGDNCNWNLNHKQTVDIPYDKNSNCYILKNEYNNDGKIISKWSNKLTAINKLLNELLKNLNYKLSSDINVVWIVVEK